MLLHARMRESGLFGGGEEVEHDHINFLQRYICDAVRSFLRNNSTGQSICHCSFVKSSLHICFISTCGRSWNYLCCKSGSTLHQQDEFWDKCNILILYVCLYKYFFSNSPWVVYLTVVILCHQYAIFRGIIAIGYCAGYSVIIAVFWKYWILV